jgi:hypothetical protein
MTKAKDEQKKKKRVSLKERTLRTRETPGYKEG